jgi:hypothetical protein
MKWWPFKRRVVAWNVQKDVTVWELSEVIRFFLFVGYSDLPTDPNILRHLKVISGGDV